MYSRLILAFLLVLSIASTALPRADVIQDDSSDDDQALAVLPYDRYQAQEIAAIFNAELEKGSDISPLIDKYFVNDFDKRFAAEASENFSFPAKPKALAQASSSDVRRYYVALTNFEFLFIRLLYTSKKQAQEKKIAEGIEAEDVDDDEKRFPKQVVEAFRSSPYLSKLIPQKSSDDANRPEAEPQLAESSKPAEPESEPDECEHCLTTIEQIREVAYAMEVACTRMRAHLATLPAEKTALDYITPKDGDPLDIESSFGAAENAYITNENSFYGVPKGTRLVCAGVFNLHLDMIRVDGQLKVLAAYMPMDD